jgi:hypothetical protein
VLQAGGAESDESRGNALAIFSEAYWPPLYTFVRRRGFADKWYYDGDNKKWVQPIPVRKGI